MKAIFRRDWILARKTLSFYGMVLLLFFGFAMVRGGDSTTFGIFWGLGLLIGITFLTANAEEAGWLRLVMAAGLPRRRYVQAKFLEYLLGLSILVCMGVLMCVRMSFERQTTALVCGCLVAGFSFGGIAIAFLVRKAFLAATDAYLVMLVSLVPSAGLAVGAALSVSAYGAVLSLPFFGAAVLLLAASYFLALFFFRKREF